ncbi:MAG: glycosyltransferase [Patescibacteria group bacterium]
MSKILTQVIPPVSIIIPTLNEEKYLPALLNSLRNINSPLEIIVVDGNSTDGTVQVVAEHQPHFYGDSSLRIIEAKERGISLQRNLGAYEAQHDIFIFCDADMVAPSHQSFSLYISNFIHKKSVVASPVLVPIERGIRIALLHKVMAGAQRLLLSLRRPYFGGAGLTTTKEVFYAVGGFDTNLLLGEDVDYSLRASKHGPYHQINVKWSVSARRFIKYGYRWILKETPELLRLLSKGRIKNAKTVFYPFGEYTE